MCVQVSMELIDTYTHCFNNIRFQRALHFEPQCTCSGSPCVYKAGGVPDKLCVFPADES